MTDESLQRNIKCSTKECEVFAGYCETVLHKKLKYEPLNNVEDFDSPWGMDFDGVTVVANEDFTEFEVGHEQYHPGTYWNPPETDYVEYSRHKTINNALWDVLTLWLKFDYSNWQESQWAEECYGELEEE